MVSILQATSFCGLFFGSLVEQEEIAAAGAMRSPRTLVIVLLFAAFATVQALSNTGTRLLVITEDAEVDQQKYSRFLGDLKGSTT